MLWKIYIIVAYKRCSTTSSKAILLDTRLLFWVGLGTRLHLQLHKSEILCRENRGCATFAEHKGLSPLHVMVCTDSAIHQMNEWLRATNPMAWPMSWYPAHSMLMDSVVQYWMNGDFQCWFKVSSTCIDLKSHNPFLSKHLCQRVESHRFKSPDPGNLSFVWRNGCPGCHWMHGLRLSCMHGLRLSHGEHTYNSKSDPWGRELAGL